jgi:hypothetical protein
MEIAIGGSSVYATQELLEQQYSPTDEEKFPVFLDSTLVRFARQIYRTYCAHHSRMTRRPLGVAINRQTRRGQVIFGIQPILLPAERFVSFDQLESEMD